MKYGIKPLCLTVPRYHKAVHATRGFEGMLVDKVSAGMGYATKLKSLVLNPWPSISL